MIIIGYQGIGKSTLGGTKKFIDLESGNFWTIDKNGHVIRVENWYEPYCNIAEHLSTQGYDIFVSSHDVVRKQLKNSKENVVIVCPSLELKDFWIEKLKARYDETQLVKDYKAYMNALERYTENIKELMSENIPYIQIEDINYNLGQMLLTYKENFNI